MPSGYTHCMLSRKFSEKLETVNPDLFFLLAEKLKYFQLGSLGPDLPYSQMMFGFGNHEEKIADKFHYEKTNEIFLSALEKIKGMPNDDQRHEAFSFFLGFASHIVADGVIHPFIRDKVGDYDQNKTAHRTLEMRIDVYLYNHYFGGNLNFSDLHDQMLDVFQRDFSHISGLVSKLIQNTYGWNVKRERIESWVRDMHNVFGTAENEQNHYYSRLGIGDFLFQDYEDVLKNKEIDMLLRNSDAIGRSKNFMNRDIHLIKDCIPMYEQAFMNIVSKAYSYVYEGKDQKIDFDFPAINLDTGRSLASNAGNDLNMPVVFWS